MDIKDWVKAARKHAKLTQEGLGTELARTKANVSAWETGSHEPSYSQLVKIAEVTGYPLLASDAAQAAINILPMDRFIRLPSDKQDIVRKMAMSALEAMEAQLSGESRPATGTHGH